MTKSPKPCKYLKGGYCSVRAKAITIKDGVARECVTCSRAKRRWDFKEGSHGQIQQ